MLNAEETVKRDALASGQEDHHYLPYGSRHEQNFRNDHGLQQQGG